jgi:hypothetical protein
MLYRCRPACLWSGQSKTARHRHGFVASPHREDRNEQDDPGRVCGDCRRWLTFRAFPTSLTAGLPRLRVARCSARSSAGRLLRAPSAGGSATRRAALTPGLARPAGSAGIPPWTLSGRAFVRRRSPLPLPMPPVPAPTPLPRSASGQRMACTSKASPPPAASEDLGVQTRRHVSPGPQATITLSDMRRPSGPAHRPFIRPQNPFRFDAGGNRL